MVTSLLCFAVLLGGALVQAVSGFGFGIFAMSLLPYFMPSYGLSVAVVNVASVMSAVPVALQRRKNARWRLIWPLLIGYAVSSAASVYFAYRQPDSLLYRLLGVLLILLSGYFAFFGNKLHIRATPLSGIVAGALSGVMGGLFAMSGPPVVLYFLSATENEREYLACSLAYFAITNVYTLALRFLNGGITGEALPYLLLAAVSALIVAVLNRRFDGRIDGKLVRRAVYGMMAVSGAALLFR